MLWELHRKKHRINLQTKYSCLLNWGFTASGLPLDMKIVSTLWVHLIEVLVRSSDFLGCLLPGNFTQTTKGGSFCTWPKQNLVFNNP